MLDKPGTFSMNSKYDNTPSEASFVAGLHLSLVNLRAIEILNLLLNNFSSSDRL